MTADDAPRMRVEVEAKRGPSGEPMVVFRAGVGAQMQVGWSLPPAAARSYAEQVLAQCDAADRMLVLPPGQDTPL